MKIIEFHLNRNQEFALKLAQNLNAIIYVHSKLRSIFQAANGLAAILAAFIVCFCAAHSIIEQMSSLINMSRSLPRVKILGF